MLSTSAKRDLLTTMVVICVQAVGTPAHRTQDATADVATNT